MASTRLRDEGPVEVDGIEIEAPDLAGSVTVTAARAATGTRGVRRRLAVDAALDAHGMDVDRRIEVTGILRRPARPGTRGGRKRAPAGEITVRVPAPREGREQVLLSRDEHGIVTWHFAEKARRRTGTATRGDRKVREYRVATRTVASARSGAAATRGGIPGLSKIIEVISFPVADAIGRGARFAVREWDTRNHPSLVRAYDPSGKLRELTPAAWKKLSAGPVLLFVHGTFSSTVDGFGRLPARTRKALDERYGGRVIAFDHPTIADDPIANARAFLLAAGDRELELDIVCHSRGGLVSRAIAERPGDLAGLAPRVRVRDIVLVGVPSNGTILADVKHWNELVDRATTLLSLLPLPVAADTMETVLALVRSISLGTARNLKGLQAMVPGGEFLATLNVPTADPGRYHAIVSDYEPRSSAWKEWLGDVVRDRIFEDAPNDMMVVIDSMAGENGSSRFPVADLQSFGPQQAVEHSMYFEQDGTSEALLRWLAG